MSDRQPEDPSEAPFHSRRLFSLSAQRRRAEAPGDPEGRSGTPDGQAQDGGTPDRDAFDLEARSSRGGLRRTGPVAWREERPGGPPAGDPARLPSGPGRHDGRPNGQPAASDERQDPMARALALLSGIDDAELREAQRASAEAAAAEAEAPATANGESADGRPGEPSAAAPPTAIRSPAPRADDVPRRPTRSLYTLQEVHERTGIPYATLALYAARFADRIPSLGERRSPAYPREGLEELCRIHAEAHPEWEPPPLGAEKGWDDLPGLAARLDSLAAVQDRLSEELHQVLKELRRGASAEAVWVD